MEPGRRWAIETFGAAGVQLRTRVAQLVRDEHDASADAQEASGHRSRGVYGQFWRGVLERFEELGQLPHGSLVRPGHAPYKIPVINGVAVFPWRYGRTGHEDLATTSFITSPARLAVTNLETAHAQGELDLGIVPPELTEEERVLAEVVEQTIGGGAGLARKLVVVAISSSPVALHDLRWGEVTLGPDGCIQWSFCEDLIKVPAGRRVGLVSTDATFTAGEPPAKRLSLRTDENIRSGSDDE